VIRLSYLAGLLGIGGVLIVSDPVLPALRTEPVSFSVFLDRSVSGEPRIEASTPFSNLHVVSQQRIGTDRPLILFFDPTSYPSTELRNDVVALGNALVRSASGKGTFPVRVGIAVLDGVLGEPLRLNPGLPQALEHAVMNYVSSGGQRSLHPARVLDIAAGLLLRAEERGPVDLLMIAKDRNPEDPESQYLAAAMERRMGQVLLRKGSTLYACIRGNGFLRRTAVASGGEAFDEETALSDVVGRVMDLRSSGFVLTVKNPDTPSDQGRIPITVKASDAAGSAFRIRGAPVLWLKPEADTIPAYPDVIQALELLRRAREAETASDFNSAGRLLERALQGDPWNGAGYALAARMSLARGNLSRAVQLAMEAIRLEPCAPETLQIYGSVFERAGRAAEALDKVRSQVDKGVPQTAEVRQTIARLMTTSGKLAEAASAYRELLNSGGSGADLHADYGWVLLKSGDSGGAAEQFGRAVSLNGDHPRALLGQAELAFGGGKLDEALDLGSRVLGAHPTDTQALLLAGKLHLKKGDWKAAAQQLETAWRLDRGSGEIFSTLLDAKIQGRKIAEAQQLLEARTSADPADRRMFRMLSDLQSSTGNMDAAASTLEAGAARVSSGRHELYRRAAELRERRGEFGQALLDYRAALDVAPPEAAREMAAALTPHMKFLSVLMAGTEEARVLPKVPPETDGSSVHGSAGNGNGGEDGFSEPAQASGLVVPGGRELLARTVGIDPAALKGPEAVERLFFHVLGAASSQSGHANENPVRRSVLAYLKHYNALLRHLVKLKLIHPEDNSEQKLVFPLTGADVKLARTDRFLSFFGVDYKYRKSDGAVSLTLSQNRTSDERMLLLRNLGVDLIGRSPREIRFTLKNESVPMLLGSEFWANRILKGAAGPKLFERLLATPKAMHLYVALASCSEGTRRAVSDSGMTTELLQLSDAIATFGRALEFRDGQLVLPGSSEAWERLLGASRSDTRAILSALLRRDEGGALQLYYGLSSAPRSVQTYVTASPERLAQFYQQLTAGNRKQTGWNFQTVAQDMGRMFKLISADDQGMFLRLDSRWARHFSAVGAQGKAPADTLQLRIDTQSLAGLVRDASNSNPTTPFSVLEMLELMSYIQAARPGLLNEDVVAALLQEPSQSPILLDVIWPLNPDAGLLARYLTYSRGLAASRDKTWKVDKVRSSQALFQLIATLSRERIFEPATAAQLLSKALDGMSAATESEFSAKLAAFVSGSLLAVLGDHLSAKSDPVLEALAGRPGKQEFLFEGRSLELDAQEFRVQRMKTAIQHQSVIPLAKLLEAYELSSRLALEPSKVAESAKELAAMLEDMQRLQNLQSTPKTVLRELPHGDLTSVREKLEKALQQKAGVPAIVTDALMKALHIELGVTLLSYSYAYHATPEIDLLTFDPHFIRKHRFSSDAAAGGMWRAAYLEQEDGFGSYITGSLSGLGHELSRLETAHSGQSFGTRQGRGLIPTLLSGMRAVPFTLRSTRAQEYVALSVRLGMELVVLSGVEPSVGGWLEPHLRHMLSPGTRERLQTWVSQPSPEPDAQPMSRSEFFLIGRAYLDDLASGCFHSNSAGWVPGANGAAPDRVAEGVPPLESPVLRRLKEIEPTRGTQEESAFRREVDQYGVHLKSRIGLDQLSFVLTDSYEMLEKSMHEEILFERICDLKIRIAELNYSLGLPANLAVFQGELALRDIVPDSDQVRTNGWKGALEQIGRLGLQNVRDWIDELLNRGCVKEMPEVTVAANEVSK
jgi:tetratricopeptide (TPR) repeat protein